MPRWRRRLAAPVAATDAALCHCHCHCHLPLPLNLKPGTETETETGTGRTRCLRLMLFRMSQTLKLLHDAPGGRAQRPVMRSRLYGTGGLGPRWICDVEP